MDHAVVAVYFALMVGAGIYGMRKARTEDDFLVAGRRLGYGFYAGTLAAVVLGGASTIGGVRLGYLYGISGMWLVVMLGLGIVTLSVFFAKRLTSLEVYTVSQVLGQRFGVPPKLIGGLVMVAYDLMVAVTATLAIGTVFDVMLGIPRVPAILIGGGLVVAYSALGGMWSITLTDVLQFVIMTVGIFFVLLPMSVSDAGGWDGLRASLPDSYFDVGAIGTDTIITYFLIYFFGIIIGQDVWQRVFTARDHKVAQRAGLGAGLYCVAYAVAGAVIGMAAKALLPDLSVPDNAFATVAKEVLPTGVSGLVLAAALAAVMSTASACTLAASTILTTDVIGKGEESLRTQRLSILAVGTAVIVVALLVQDVVAGLTIAYNLLVGGLLVPIIGALVWRRATARAALAAIVSGSLVVTFFMVRDGMLANTPIYWGLTTSAVFFVVVTFLGGRDAGSERTLGDSEPEASRA
ncbi:sodium:solute symporter [Nocardioides caldifontis]|uniref:sodium:solute symporter n=1 Tax=Nocardioides caldifontis TaxID=2588938 RepID=UPI0011DF22C3|nr:sodium:solute symporter [Nocardioides caldifontis]